MLQNGEAVLGLLLLQVEHLPELLQLLQLAEGLQYHQHDYQAENEVDSDAHFIQLPELLIGRLSGHIVSKANGTE